jgi:hypothetical protein
VNTSPWKVVPGLLDLQAARATTLRWAHQMVLTGPVARCAEQLEILEESPIPPMASDPNPYLALHFDQGHPLFPIGPTPLYLMVGLCRSPTTPESQAATRLVSLSALLTQRTWGSPADIEHRLEAYAESHGSSWDWQGESGHRVSCFARVLDALSPEPRLTNFRITPRADWYSASKAGHEFANLEEESRFYNWCGVPLDCEQRVTLSPGDLLVIDNVRAIHGRVGARAGGELHQFLVGLATCASSEADRIRRWLTALLAGERAA